MIPGVERKQAGAEVATQRAQLAKAADVAPRRERLAEVLEEGDAARARRERRP